MPFGHDESAFKKQTSLGDRLGKFSKKMWGDGKDESVETGPSAPAVKKPARKSFRVKKTLKGVLVTTKMKKLWGESQGIYQKGKAGKRGQLRSAELDLKSELAQGNTEKIKAVLGDELYAKMTKHSNVDKLSPAVSPDAKMNAQNALQEKNQTLQGGKSGPVVISSQTNSSSNQSFGGNINTFSPNQVRSNKTHRTSSVQQTP